MTDSLKQHYKEKGWIEHNGKRVCGLCFLPPTKDGHDPCLGKLPGVSFACCGHGKRNGYVAFSNGLTVRGQFDHVQSKKQAKKRLTKDGIVKKRRKLKTGKRARKPKIQQDRGGFAELADFIINGKVSE